MSKAIEIGGHAKVKRCERCKALPDKQTGVLDYCAVCAGDLCAACMKSGCCRHVPAISGMNHDFGECDKPDPHWD